MSDNMRPPDRSAVPPTQQSSSRQVVGKHWEQMVVELIASCDDRSPDPDNIDEMAIAKYLSGGCSADERAAIERTLTGSPGLAECVALAREALANTDAAA